VAKGARRPRSRFTGALEPLTQVRVAYFERERRELVSVNYFEPARSPLATTAGEALAYVGYFAELIDEWAADADPDERLYRLGTSVIEALSSGAPVTLLARYFEYWLLRLQGVYPPHVTCHGCGAPLDDVSRGGAYLVSGGRALTCAHCLPAPPAGMLGLSPAALTLLREMRGTSPHRLGDTVVPVAALHELEAVHRSLIVTHLEREPKSMRVLKAIEAH
jgi:DNA repair protein RecO (recombination protein O)